MTRTAAAALCAAAAVAVAASVLEAQSTGPAALGVVSANRTQVIAQLGLGQWGVVGMARACDAAAFRFAARDGTLRATAGIVLTPARSVAATERPAVDAVIHQVFATREREQRLDARDLSRASVAVDAVYGARSTAGTVYYFEASKRLHDAAPAADADADGEVDPRGIVRVTVSGWLHGGGRMVPAGTKSELHWDPVEARGQSSAPPDLEPLGVVNGAESADSLWVMRRTIGNRVSYLLYSVGASSVRLLLTVPAVNCE